MQPADLAARAVAIIVTRDIVARRNVPICALPGREDLRSRYRALMRILNSRYGFAERTRIALGLLTPSYKDPVALYASLVGTIESDRRFAERLEALLSDGVVTGDDPAPRSRFPRLITRPFSRWLGRGQISDFGRLVLYVVSRWDELPEAQRTLAKGCEEWIADAAKPWPEDFRNQKSMRQELARSARILHLFMNVWLLRRLARLLDPSRLDKVRDFPGLAFPAVLDDEMEEIEIRRAALTGQMPHPATAATAGAPGERADQAGLVGLAFSGGGIRSATFNLGVLQFLGDSGMLRKFDYLSTVSGGGYIGSWLHAWIHRADREAGLSPGIDHVGYCLSPTNVPDPQDERVAPIRFLRRYSNYLTPQTGIMSADTWTMLNIWLRNTFLNIVILALALSAILIAPQWMAIAGYFLNRSHATEYWWVLMIVPACLIGLNLATFHRDLKRHWVPKSLLREPAIFLLIVAPIFLASWGAGTFAPNHLIPKKIDEGITGIGKAVAPERTAKSQTEQPEAQTSSPEDEAAADDAQDTDARKMNDSLLFAGVMLGLFMVVSVAGRLDLNFYPANHPRRAKFPSRCRVVLTAYWKILWICFVAAIPSWGLAYLALDRIRNNPHGALGILTLGAPAFLAMIGVVVFLYMGFLGRRFPDDRREWMARLGGWLAICCVGWLALCGTATYGPDITDWIVDKVNNFVGRQSAGISLISVVTAVSGLLAGRASTKNAGSRVAGIPRGVIARVAPPICVAGILLLLSRGLSLLGDDPGATPDLDTGLAAFLFGTVFLGGLAWFISGRVDINEFSLHQFYRNRLVRCYLGGARSETRTPDPFTGFDGADDFPVFSLAPSRGYSGPYPIFNTTLNVSHGGELAWQERKGESFFFTPNFSGFDVEDGRARHARGRAGRKLSSGGYRATCSYACPETKGVSVGTAVAISGAAASPNQGKNTAAAMAFLMTVLDVRLGWWLGNPRRTDGWTKAGPKTGLFQLFAELAGSTNDKGKYVNLSDGGHFENLAVYELIRRRCRTIVACDSEQDRNYTFGGLGNLIRKCRSDFGVEIEIATAKVTPAAGGRFTEEHCVTGTIRYPRDARGRSVEGRLIYIKSSLTGNESADVLQYATQSPQFPHESTADQWFDESQFESYRHLGFQVAESAGKEFAAAGLLAGMSLDASVKPAIFTAAG